MNPIALPRGSTSTHQATALLSQTSYHLEWAAYYTSDNHKRSVFVIVICSASNSAYIPSGAISGFKKKPKPVLNLISLPAVLPLQKGRMR